MSNPAVKACVKTLMYCAPEMVEEHLEELYQTGVGAGEMVERLRRARQRKKFVQLVPLIMGTYSGDGCGINHYEHVEIMIGLTETGELMRIEVANSGKQVEIVPTFVAVPEICDPSQTELDLDG